MILFGDPGDEQAGAWLDESMRSAKAEIEATPAQLRREPGDTKSNAEPFAQQPARDPKYWEAHDPEFWDATDAEVLIHTTVDEAIEAALDDMDACDQPDELVVRGMAPMSPSFGARKATELCEDLLDCLDEEFGNPYGDEVQKPTEEMVMAAEALLRSVASGYKSWACEEVCSVTVNVKEWVEKNRPDWLDGASS